MVSGTNFITILLMLIGSGLIVTHHVIGHGFGEFSYWAMSGAFCFVLAIGAHIIYNPDS